MPVLFGIGVFLRETNFKMWNHRFDLIKYRANLVNICYLLILTLEFPLGVWWKFTSSSAPRDVIDYSPFIFMIHKSCLAYVGSWWPAGEFENLSVMYGIVKYSSSRGLNQTFFPEGDNWISYVRKNLSKNGWDIRSSSYGIKLKRSELWIWPSGFCQRSKEPGVCLSFI